MRHIILITALLSNLVFADIFDIFKRTKGVQNPQDELYADACGECHFAYQPGWLPKRSWEKMMRPGELEDHFGDVADMDEEDRLLTLRFLLDNSAQTSNYKSSKKIMASIKDGEIPLRISKTRYLERKHSKIDKKWIEQKEVKSLAQCNKCHTRADKGSFDDDEVKIPNYGAWEK